MMKILLINKFDNKGGAAIATKRNYEMLKKLNQNVKFLVLEGKNADFKILNNNWKKKTGFLKFAFGRLHDYFFLKEKNNVFYFDSLKFGFDITKHPAIKQADIIHLNWINFGFLNYNSLEKLVNTGKKIVWTLHDMWALTGGCFHSRGCEKYSSDCSDCPYLKIKFLAKNNLRKKISILNKKNVFPVAISNWMKEKIEKSAVFINKPVLIPNPLDTDFYKPFNKIEAKKKLKLNPGKIHLGFIAFNVSNYYKGGTYLIQALKKLKSIDNQLFKKIQLIAIGRLKQKDFFPTDFDIYFTGYIDSEDKMRDFYNAFDLFVHPSLEESFSMVVQEAMSCGTPAVAFNVGGIPDIIDNNINGYLAEYKNAEDLAQKIYNLLINKELQKKFSLSARQKIIRNFDYKVIGKKLMEFYESCLMPNRYQNAES